ncbi:MAG TPA: OmpW family outer membrane protein [Sphingobium sp.]
MKSRLLACLAGAAAVMTPMAAHAGSPDGKIQIKLLATGVLPDGKIKSVESNALGANAATQTAASDNWVPTAAIEYFLSPGISVETICCFTSHHVDGTAGSVAGRNNLIDNIMILPATVTLKAHLTGMGPLKPYIGAGPSYFIILDSKVGAGGTAIGATSAKVRSKVGFALQAGLDFAVNDQGLGISIDAKRYFMKPLASFYVGNTEVLRTRHDLDPWVVSAGLAYRF